MCICAPRFIRRIAMYGLPKDFDGKFFLNRRLELLSFSEYTVYFDFDEKVSISVGSSFQHHTASNNGNAPIQEVPVNESNLMQLVGHAVIRSKGEQNGTLMLEFDH